MTALQWIGRIYGALSTLVGGFWALQGAGIIMWPSNSFMLADPKWTFFGSLFAVGGILLFLNSGSRRA